VDRSNPTVLIPSLHELYSDAGNGFGSTGLPDEAVMDFSDPPPTDVELDEIYAHEQGRRAAEAVAVHPDYARFRGDVAQLRDDTLITTIGLVDESAPGRGWCVYMGLDTVEAKAAWTHAATLELLKRLSDRQRAARAAA
jgi:hypothetical protein